MPSLRRLLSVLDEQSRCFEDAKTLSLAGGGGRFVVAVGLVVAFNDGRCVVVLVLVIMVEFWRERLKSG